MDDYESLNYSVWTCKYHVVFIPKYRRKSLFGEIRRQLGQVFRTLAKQKESHVEEGHLMPDHVHMLISIPPKHSSRLPGRWCTRASLRSAQREPKVLGSLHSRPVPPQAPLYFGGAESRGQPSSASMSLHPSPGWVSG